MKRLECPALNSKTNDKDRDYACAMMIRASNASDSLETDDEADWKYEVQNGDTVLGYQEWLEHQREINK